MEIEMELISLQPKLTQSHNDCPLKKLLAVMSNPKNDSTNYNHDYDKNDAIIIQGLLGAIAPNSVNGCKSAVDREGTVIKYNKVSFSTKIPSNLISIEGLLIVRSIQG